MLIICHVGRAPDYEKISDFVNTSGPSSANHGMHACYKQKDTEKEAERAAARDHAVICVRVGADGAAGRGFGGRALDYGTICDFDNASDPPSTVHTTGNMARARERERARTRGVFVFTRSGKFLVL